MNRDIYNELGVSKIINAKGAHTIVGGSRMSPNTLSAMCQASESFVEITQLQKKVHARIAEITGNEASYITCGASAGIYLVAAACISHKRKRDFIYLKQDEVNRCEIIIHKGHRNPYDWPLSQLGVKILELGYSNPILPVTPKDLHHAIGENTVAILYTPMEQGLISSIGTLDLDSTMEVAKERSIPLILDCAAQLPPAENLWRFTQKGATAALFSGGKNLCGPQSTGLIVGKKWLLDICESTGFPYYGIGRMLKVGREEMVGLMVAIEEYLARDHGSHLHWYETQVQKLKEAFLEVENVDVTRVFPNVAGQPVPRAKVTLHNKNGPVSKMIVDKLMGDEPKVAVDLAGKDSIYVNPLMMRDGEMEVVIERLKTILKRWE